MFSSFADKKDPKVKNVLHYNNLIERLDLHLTEIDLIVYRGSTSEIKWPGSLFWRQVCSR